MTMLHHEWLRLARSRNFWGLLAAGAVLLTYGTVTGVIAARERAAAIASAEREAVAARARAQSPYEIGRVGALVTLPMRDGAAFSVGQSDIYPSTDAVSIMAKSRRRADRYELESPLTLASGRFDLAFVLVYVMPLLLLALMHGLLGEERDDGTLALLLSHPISLSRVLASKVLTRAGALWVLALVTPVTVMAVMGALPSVTTLSHYLLLVTAYIAFWASLAVAVNVGATSGAGSAVALATLWVALTIVVPSVSSVVVTRLAPIPSRFELLDVLRGDEVRNLDGDRLLSQYLGDHPELGGDATKAAGFAPRFAMVQRETMRRTQPVEERFAAQRRARAELASTVRFVSPCAIMREALDTLAGTDTRRFLDFRVRVDALAPAWADWIAPAIASGTGAVDAQAEPRIAAGSEPPATRALGLALAGLAAYGLAALAFTITRLRGAAATIATAHP